MNQNVYLPKAYDVLDNDLFDLPKLGRPHGANAHNFEGDVAIHHTRIPGADSFQASNVEESSGRLRNQRAEGWGAKDPRALGDGYDALLDGGVVDVDKLAILDAFAAVGVFIFDLDSHSVSAIQDADGIRGGNAEDFTTNALLDSSIVGSSFEVGDGYTAFGCHGFDASFHGVKSCNTDTTQCVFVLKITFLF